MIDLHVENVVTPYLKEKAKRVLPRLLEAEELLENGRNQHRLIKIQLTFSLFSFNSKYL
jgi:hypothetical protein